MKKIIAGLAGASVGFMTGLAIVWLVVALLERPPNSSGFSESLGLEISYFSICGLVMTTWLGLYFGLEIEWAKREKHQKQIESQIDENQK